MSELAKQIREAKAIIEKGPVEPMVCILTPKQWDCWVKALGEPPDWIVKSSPHDPDNP